MNERLSLEGSLHPNFIGCWEMEDNVLCDHLVTFFENNKATQKLGRSGNNSLNTEIKKSTDITISPHDLDDDKFFHVSMYIEYLKSCYLDYLEQWSFLKTFLPDVHIGPFNLQKYEQGGHFGLLHSERTSLSTLHRTHVWMTYLNNVSDGGETEFPMFGIKVKPEKGKTLIWPAEWTHAHLGGVVNKGSKYIITGWMHFPYP